MKKIKFTVEKTKTGFSAYADNFEKYPVTTTGKNLDELKVNMLDALNAWLEYKGQPLAGTEDIAIKIDLPQLFDYYKELNAKAISKRAGINATLLSQYINGKKTPSEKQTERILHEISAFGKELADLELAGN
jgi:hypothetical protein